MSFKNRIKTQREDLSYGITPGKIADNQSSCIEKYLSVPFQNSSDDIENIAEHEVRTALSRVNQDNVPGPDGLTASLNESNIDFFRSGTHRTIQKL